MDKIPPSDTLPLFCKACKNWTSYEPNDSGKGKALHEIQASAAEGCRYCAVTVKIVYSFYSQPDPNFKISVDGDFRRGHAVELNICPGNDLELSLECYAVDSKCDESSWSTG